MKDRRHSVLQHAKKIGCDSVAAFEPENLFYLTGFWGEAVAICSDNGTKLIAPKLEVFRAEQTSVDCEVIPTERGSELTSKVISEIFGKKTCTDCSDYSTIETIRKNNSLVVNTDPFFQARRIKDAKELKIIAAAAKILDRLYEICTEEIKEGMSERELQAKLIYEAMKMGANPPSYKSTLNPLIIAGGPNGALPHFEVSERKFKKNDMIVVDLTLRHEGYIADATRTFALGSHSQEMKKVYDTVKKSQQAGLDAAIDGVTCGKIDAICRDIIKKEGYEKQFIHSTGHGIGLDVHEPPWLRAENKELLKTDMAVTIEPGIYLENKFGVRIEDSILIVGNGKPRVLNKFTKDLIVLD